MTRRAALLAVALALAPGPARAELWLWTDAAGDERWTDDPSSVPREQASTLRRADDPGRPEAEEGGGFSAVSPRNEEPPPESPDERRRREKREEQLRLLEVELIEREREVEQLRKQHVRAENEHRRFRYGGRVGAFERANEAKAEAERLRVAREHAERQLDALRGRIELLQDR